jgi:hypothetical protein
MRTIIAGSRSIAEYDEIVRAVASAPFTVTAVVSGGARGVDRLGERYAREHALPLTIRPADWNRYGRSAGYRRNEEMAREANALVAVWDGESRGTAHMIELARKHGLVVHVHRSR